MLAALPDDVASRVSATAIDLRPRPDGLDERISWVHGTAPHAVKRGMRGLLVAHEWLDDVPLDVVQVDDDGQVRLVLVDETGEESLGPSLADDDGWQRYGLDAAEARAWLSRWWPASRPGERAELGHTRDADWSEAARRVAAGTALAVDYGHQRETRPRDGSLAAYAGGRLVRPVPDGRANLTAHVALDSVAAASGALLTTQREALRGLGVRVERPEPELASRRPVEYAEALAAASDASELLDPVGLGRFGWLRVDVG
jgi:SAM-dependent MidA family methyltransferase